jgi:hypothetical protein
MELEVLTVEIAGGAAEVTWECRSPAFDQPVRGIDHYRFEDGLISELAVTIDSTPD